MPGRTITGTSQYRYGFNGKELDPSMDGNNYDYGARIYNPQIGKFLSTDPLQKKYPELTPYQFASNSPIVLIDIDGKEGGWELSTPLNNLKIRMELASKLPPKHTGNAATSTPSPVIQPYNISLTHSEAPPLEIRRIQQMVHSNTQDGSNQTNNKQKNTDYTKEFIETGNEVAEHGEKVLDLFGKEKVAKQFGKAGSLFMGASATYNIAKGKYAAAALDVAEFFIGKTAAAPYYYGSKLMKEMMFSDFTMSQAWMDAQAKLQVAVNNYHYYSDTNSDHYDESEAKRWYKDAAENKTIQEGIEREFLKKKSEK